MKDKKFKIITTITLIAATFVAFQCASVAGTKFDSNKVSSIEVCKTTKDDILNMFGEPRNTGHQNGFTTMQYLYATTQKAESFTAFLKSDTVVDFILNPAALHTPVDKCLEVN